MSRFLTASDSGGDSMPGFADALINLILILCLFGCALMMGLLALRLVISEQGSEFARAAVRQTALGERRALALARAEEVEAAKALRERAPVAPLFAPSGAHDRPSGRAARDSEAAGVRRDSTGERGVSVSGAGDPGTALVIRIQTPAAAPAPAAAGVQVTQRGAASPISAEAAALAAIGGDLVGRLDFDFAETRWSAQRPLPVTNALPEGSQRTLVAFAENSDRRQMVLAFGRLNSVRQVLVEEGIPAASLRLRVLQPTSPLLGDVLANTPVYVIDGRQP